MGGLCRGLAVSCALLSAGCVIEVNVEPLDAAPPVIRVADAAPADAAVDGAADATVDATPVLADAAPDTSCGVGTVAIPLELGVEVSGSTVGKTEILEASCTGTTGPEQPYRVTLTAEQLPATLVATADLPGTDYDAVISLRQLCANVATELDCDDFSGAAGDTVTAAISIPGDYYIIIDSHSGQSGNYALRADLQ